MVDAKAEAPVLSKQTRSDGCLLVAFEKDPSLALVESCPAQPFRMGERLYQDQGYGDWTGFYDWLRKDSAEIVGVRYWPFERTEFLIDHLAKAKLSYVQTPVARRRVEVYFALVGSHGVDPRKSDDQTFGSNRIFLCKQNRWLISFDTTRLSESEIQTIRAVNARWETVSMSANGGAQAVGQAAGT